MFLCGTGALHGMQQSMQLDSGDCVEYAEWCDAADNHFWYGLDGGWRGRERDKWESANNLPGEWEEQTDEGKKVKAEMFAWFKREAPKYLTSCSDASIHYKFPMILRPDPKGFVRKSFERLSSFGGAVVQKGRTAATWSINKIKRVSSVTQDKIKMWWQRGKYWMIRRVSTVASNKRVNSRNITYYNSLGLEDLVQKSSKRNLSTGKPVLSVIRYNPKSLYYKTPLNYSLLDQFVKINRLVEHQANKDALFQVDVLDEKQDTLGDLVFKNVCRKDKTLPNFDQQMTSMFLIKNDLLISYCDYPLGSSGVQASLSLVTSISKANMKQCSPTDEVIRSYLEVAYENTMRLALGLGKTRVLLFPIGIDNGIRQELVINAVINAFNVIKTEFQSSRLDVMFVYPDNLWGENKSSNYDDNLHSSVVKSGGSWYVLCLGERNSLLFLYDKRYLVYVNGHLKEILNKVFVSDFDKAQKVL